MLRYLLDEQISHVVAEQLSAKHPEVVAVSVHHWRDAEFRGRQDDLILEAATRESLTLVTYDVRTILPLLRRMGHDGLTHGGVIFVRRSVAASSNVGALVRLLARFWEAHASKDWTNRTAFLSRSS